MAVRWSTPAHVSSLEWRALPAFRGLTKLWVRADGIGTRPPLSQGPHSCSADPHGSDGTGFSGRPD
jgi:hypothetical protein